MNYETTFMRALSQLAARYATAISHVEGRELEFDAADKFARCLRDAGWHSIVKTECDEDGVTICVETTLPPSMVGEWLARHGFCARLIDWSELCESMTYLVMFNGIDIALYSKSAKSCRRRAA